MKLTWYLSFANIPEILNGQPCLDVKFSFKPVSRKVGAGGKEIIFWTYSSSLVRGKLEEFELQNLILSLNFQP